MVSTSLRFSAPSPVVVEAPVVNLLQSGLKHAVDVGETLCLVRLQAALPRLKLRTIRYIGNLAC